MSRLRILFVWLLMAAVPMQGFAAASMLFCGSGSQRQHTHVQAGAMAAVANHGEAHTAAPHDHASHSHAGKAHGNAADKKHGLPDATHKCSTCAACCNVVAMIGPQHEIALAPAPKADLAEPFVLILVRATPVPDKPPRA